MLLMPLITQAQIITTIAGNGTAGSSGDGGMATDAAINPRYCAIDAIGNIYFTESYPYSRVRKVDPSGRITRFAGSDTTGFGFSGDGLPATMARFSYIVGIAVDGANNIYIADRGNARIRKVDAITGIVTTVAGGGTSGNPWMISGVPATATSINGYFGISGVCTDKNGNFYLTNYSQVAKVDTAGILSVVAGDTFLTIYYPEDHSTPEPATAAKLVALSGMCSDAIGNIYFGYFNTPDHWKYSLSSILMVDTNGILSKYAGTGIDGYSGDGGAATDGKIDGGKGLATDLSGNLYFAANYYPTIRKVDGSGMMCTVTGQLNPGFSGDGGPATAATLTFPDGLACDGYGNIYIADNGNNRIRKVIQPECNILETGIADIILPQLAGIDPNPATNKLTISASVLINTVVITNVLGQLIYSQGYHLKQVEIDISTIPTGIYLIRINGTEVRRFVKE